jgi:hypothetical protein
MSAVLPKVDTLRICEICIYGIAVLLEYLLGASEETGHWWKKARTGLQDGR